MSERRIGILIASSRFPKESKLEDLRFPEKDVDGLNEILTSQDHGQFTQTFLLKNKLHHEILLKINQVLREADKNDLVLIYYSGHGKLNPAGKLHLTSTDSVINALEATSIPVSTIRDYVDISSSNKIVLILDCCFSGAAGEAFARGGVDDQLHLVSGGRGTYILTASTGIQVAQEKESDQYGVFTKHLIEGIKSGEADLDNDGRITMGDLYRYVHDHVLHEGFQEPMKWDLNVRGELIIARSGKTPRKERGKQIREIIFDLAKKGLLPDDILDKSREVISLEPDQLSEEDRTYDKLLDQLQKKRLEPVEFIRKWDKVRPGKPDLQTKELKELKRKAEEEKHRKEEDVKRKAEEEQKRRAFKEEIKPEKSEPAKVKPPESEPDVKTIAEIKSPEPRKTGNALKFGAVVGVLVLLITGGWMYYNYQQKKEISTKWNLVQKKETISKIEGFHKQVEGLERVVAKVDNQAQLKELSNQRENLSHQVEGFSEQATKVGLKSPLSEVQDRLKQVQIQLANKEKEFSEVRQEIEKFDRHALNLEHAAVNIDKPEQIEELYRQRDTLSQQVEGLSERATKVGLESQLEQLQDRLKQVQIQLANKEKELIAARKGRIFVESVPENSIVKIMNIDQLFQQGIELEPGEFRLQVSSKGYEPQERLIELGPGEEKNINFELIKIMPEFVRLHVETVPEDATIRILNTKPKFHQGMALEPGRYHVEVAAEGYETQRLWVALTAGHEEPFKFELEKIKTTAPPLPPKLLTNGIGMKFMLIQAGSFTMGSQISPEEVAKSYGGEAKYYKDEQPPHPVEIAKPFYLQTTEVSQGQWEKVMGDNLSSFKDCGDDCPVEKVSWDDAQKFISELNQLEGTNKYRLPTEAEWEYACRAGTETAYSFGNEVDKLGKYAWYSDNSGGKTKPVGKKKPNAWGLYDMHGNVYEWCQDWYGNYPSNSVADPKGPDKAKYRVLRGGSWNNNARYQRSANRSRNDPGNRYDNFGFRVARDF